MTTASPYPYTLCGLSKVFLFGGVTHHTTPYGDGISIAKADELHMVLVEAVLALKRTMTGEEHRYVRKALEIAPVAASLGAEKSVIFRAEADAFGPVPEKMDASLRFAVGADTAFVLPERMREHRSGDPINVVYDGTAWTLSKSA